MIENTDRAYMAAILDGEGAIGISFTKNPNGRRTYRLTVNITSTSIEWLIALRDLWGSVGSLTLRKRHASRWKPTLAWQVRGGDAQQLLREVYPYLQIKKNRAALALKFPLGQVGKKIDPKRLTIQSAIAAELSVLNKRGPIEAIVH